MGKVLVCGKGGAINLSGRGEHGVNALDLLPSFSRSNIEEIINDGFTTEEFEAYTVSKDVTNSRVKSDREDILSPYHYQELNKLF